MRLVVCSFILIIAGASGLTAAGSGSERGYGGDIARMEDQIEFLEKELASLKAQLKKAKMAAKMKGAQLLDDMENAVLWENPGGGSWWVGFDQNGMGTTLDPDPFEFSKGGCEASPGHSARIHGHLGPMEEPWAWATMGYSWHQDGGPKPQDLNEFGGVAFWIKGSKGEVKVVLDREAVKDHNHFQTTIGVGPQWRRVVLPFGDFKQPQWGKALKQTFPDVKGIHFSPALHESDYDFRIDQLELVEKTK